MSSISLPFPNRSVAGRELAAVLKTYERKSGTVVLAMVRGGIVVGRAVADALKLPLYPYIVRKLGHPGHREYGLGAIAEGGATYLDDRMMQSAGVTWEDMQPVIQEETAELQRRREAYLVSARPALRGRTVLLVDDGAATGVSLFAAIEDLRNAKVDSIVVALPVCPPDTAEMLRKRANKLVTLATPEPFDAVGAWYGEFPQVEDEEVLRLLTVDKHP